MAARARHLPFHDDDFLRGERIGPPLGGYRGRMLLKGAILLLAAGAAGWATFSDQAWRQWVSPEMRTQLSRLIERVGAHLQTQAQPAPRIAAPPKRSEPPMRPAALEAPPLAPLPTASNPAPMPDYAASKAEPPTAAEPLTTGSLPASAGAPGQPLPAPTVDPANPYQVRAAAVGLHPDLSSVLLARLTATDYRNAAYAIETAVKETADSAVFVWPRQRKPELALFRVRFVAGAALGCRRYVVTVVKDGWSTTAMPMEKCKSEQVSARRR
ncbi:MAG TPA: hypothetical protein VFR00_08230 [Hyphomicrobiaceae bacterium]|nr:hypothetical protein [Hyphomicrobiaceae bacterium]